MDSTGSQTGQCEKRIMEMITCTLVSDLCWLLQDTAVVCKVLLQQHATTCLHLGREGQQRGAESPPPRTFKPQELF